MTLNRASLANSHGRMGCIPVKRRTPVTERDDALWAMPTITSQMPVVFGSDVKWTRVSGHCAECGDTIPDSDMRGTVTRPVATCAVVDAVGICRRCRCLTRYVYRLHADMRVSAPTESGRKEWSHRPSLLDRLSRAAANALRLVRRGGH